MIEGERGRERGEIELSSEMDDDDDDDDDWCFTATSVLIGRLNGPRVEKWINRLVCDIDKKYILCLIKTFKTTSSLNQKKYNFCIFSDTKCPCKCRLNVYSLHN